MKKTIIALAVAASAAISGSAMAWTPNGTQGSVELSGTLTPPTIATPWEVQAGASVSGLDAAIQQGQTEVSIQTSDVIPVLAIRTSDSQAFAGQAGISPHIDYQGAIDVSQFANGVTTMTLDVNDEQGQKIGTLEAPLVGVGVFSWKRDDGSDGASSAMYVDTSDATSGFTGGLPTTATSALPNSDAVAAILLAEIAQNFDAQGYTYSSTPGASNFNAADPTHYSGYYVAGVRANEPLKITLDTPAAGDAEIPWKASLPLIVSYQ